MQKHLALLQAVDNDSKLVDSELDVYRFKVLKGTLLKKYVDSPERAEHLHDAALQDFLVRNASMSARRDYAVNPYVGLLNNVKGRLTSLLLSGEFQTNIITLGACAERGGCGPGSSRGVRFSDFVGKLFCSDITTTSLGLYQHFVGTVSDRWLEAENSRALLHTVTTVCGSNITTVPKDATKNRVIATEPSLNMFYQLGAKELLENVLRKSFKLCVSRQPQLNKILACSGSIDGSNATIDLQNASDSWHVDLIKYLLPEEVYSVLDLIRSKTATVDGIDVQLSMFSTMGNGFTFPLMTLLFTVILDEFLRERNDSYTPYRDGVFGDDIILPSRYSSEFIDLLEKLGFIVNTDKSFTTGHFRESCGGDFYHGYDTRGVYIKRFTTDEDYYSTFNRILAWGVRNGVTVTNTLLYLKGLVNFRPVPMDEADYAGFKIPSAVLKSPKFDGNGATIYKASVPIPRTRRVRDDYENTSGALIGFLGGFVRDNVITTRKDSEEEVTYKVIKCKTPSWDFIPDARVSHGAVMFQFMVLLST